VRELTAGRGVDCVVEIGGPGTIAMSLKALAVGGHVSLIGVSLSQSGAGLDPLLLTGRGITLGRRAFVTGSARNAITLQAADQQERIVGISGYVVRPPQARHEKRRVSAFTSAKRETPLRNGPP
jgi:NADPH:quinone reductase-like Zn-dependent oxidoreductase